MPRAPKRKSGFRVKTGKTILGRNRTVVSSKEVHSVRVGRNRVVITLKGGGKMPKRPNRPKRGKGGNRGGGGAGGANRPIWEFPGQKGQGVIKGSKYTINREPDVFTLGRIPTRPIVRRRRRP